MCILMAFEVDVAVFANAGEGGHWQAVGEHQKRNIDHNGELTLRAVKLAKVGGGIDSNRHEFLRRKPHVLAANVVGVHVIHPRLRRHIRHFL